MKYIFYLIIFIAFLLLFYIIDAQLLDIINTNLLVLIDFANTSTTEAKVIFFLIYILLTSLSLPVAFILGILSGVLFDVFDALIIVSFASSVGATSAFLISRYFFRNYIASKFSQQYSSIDTGFRENGAFYLYAIRMSPIFPYFMINFLFGLTSMKTYIFYLVTQIGMLPMTFIIILTGDKMYEMLNANISFDINILVLLSLLGLLPFIFKKLFFKYLGNHE